MTIFKEEPYTCGMDAPRRTRHESTASDDRRIVLRVRHGDRQAYAVLVDRYQVPVYNLMLRMARCPDIALELTQDAFTRAYEKLDGYDADRPFFPWLYTLGLNIARDHLRGMDADGHLTRSLDQMCEAGLEPPSPEFNEDAPYERVMERGRLNKALSTLPELTREALVLRFREGLSFPEIAETLGLGLSSAKMTVQRGLEKMRKLLPREDF